MSRGLDPNALLDAIFPQMRLALPPELPTAYFDAFVRRSRPRLLALLERLLQVGPVDDLPELWTARKRSDANLQAMNLLAQLANVVQPGQTRAGLPIGWQDHFSQIHLRTPAEPERRILMQYSGWGGLSIEAAASRFAAGIPHPEERGLIHEYFTPTRVTREVARVISPLLPGLLDSSGAIHALEPSAGIGRFLNSFAGTTDIRWHVVEWSALSALLLKALYPELDLYLGPFERWVRDQGARWAGRLNLVVSNPPYGARGASVTDDPDRSYREKKAYLYFLRRGLDLLAPNGLGVFLVPAGFMTGNNNVLRDAREKVLRRHHLAAAYRLPSQRPGGSGAIFPGATLVTDLLFFRARGGELAEVDEADRPLLDGQYFQQFPTHLLGRELGTERGDDDQTSTPRYHY
ncbi:MAG TPA: N-6 DNA methylase, partial [Myxococcota bacterium]|nr:N-6 DNA methylase [Myxococcota bacterium]